MLPTSGGEMPEPRLDWDGTDAVLSGTSMLADRPPITFNVNNPRIPDVGWINQWALRDENPLRVPIEQAEVERIVDEWLNTNMETVLGDIVAALPHVGDEPPPAPVPHGKFWINTNDARTYVAFPQSHHPDDYVWVEVGGGGGGGGTTLGITNVTAAQPTPANVQAGINEVTGSGGVVWQSPSAGGQCFVRNANTNEAIWFYPPSGAHLNDGAPPQRLSIQPNSTGYFIAMSNIRIVSVP